MREENLNLNEDFINGEHIHSLLYGRLLNAEMVNTVNENILSLMREQGVYISNSSFNESKPQKKSLLKNFRTGRKNPIY